MTQTTGTAFGAYTSNRWFGTNRQTTVYRAYPSRTENPDLTWEKRKEYNIGIDALILNNRLSLEFNYYNVLRDGQISQVVYEAPLVAGISGAMPYMNYNSTRYYGFEGGLQFTGNAGNIAYSVGGNATIQNSKLEKYDEPGYLNDYQLHTGKPADTYWGLTYLGKFANIAETSEVPQLYDAELMPGDLKYKDMNGDGFVDDNDMSAIGHTSPRLYYALNALIGIKNLEITVVGTGCAFFDLPLTNRYFWNGWGDNNYSNFVRDNVGAAYPRLTYYQVKNNFLASDFWLTKGDFFKIQNVELAYKIPLEKLKFIGSRGMRIYVRGSNLLTVSRVKDVDPESINSGVEIYPLFRTFSGGVKLTF
jgi:hypothetical protein